MGKPIKILLGAICVLLAYMLLFRERLTTPADELRAVLGYYRTLASLQDDALRRDGEYAPFNSLLNFPSNAGRFRVSSECQNGYCFQIRGEGRTYQIRIYPQSRGAAHYLSLYADQRDLIHISYGLPRADERSPLMSPVELRLFMPR